MRFNVEAYAKLFPRVTETKEDTESAIETFKVKKSVEVETEETEETEGEQETEEDGLNDNS